VVKLEESWRVPTARLPSGVFQARGRRVAIRAISTDRHSARSRESSRHSGGKGFGRAALIPDTVLPSTRAAERHEIREEIDRQHVVAVYSDEPRHVISGR